MPSRAPQWPGIRTSTSKLSCRPEGHSNVLTVSYTLSRASLVPFAVRHASTLHSTSKPATRFPIKTIAGVLLATGLSYLIYKDHQDSSNSARIATQNVRFKRSIPASSSSDEKTSVTNKKDPLSILSPDELASSTTHLVELPLSQLFRAYIVFLASSSPFLVDIAPVTIEKIEWLKENVPFIGKPLWSVLVYVSAVYSLICREIELILGIVISRACDKPSLLNS